MSFTVKLEVVKVIECTADVPDTCPNCETDLTVPGAVIEGNYNYCDVRGHLDKEVNGFLGEGTSVFSDEYHPIGYRCARCDHTLAGEGL